MRRLFVVLGAGRPARCSSGGPALAEDAVPRSTSRSSTRPASSADEPQVDGRARRAAVGGRHPALRRLRRHLRRPDGRRVGQADRRAVRPRGQRRAARGRRRGPELRLLAAARTPTVSTPRSTSWPVRRRAGVRRGGLGRRASSRSPTASATGEAPGGPGTRRRRRAARRRRRSPSSVAARTWSAANAAPEARGAAAAGDAAGEARPVRRDVHRAAAGPGEHARCSSWTRR